ncbi:MAG: SMI1/KNR4 family protein [Planctomycetota bacterium]|nr:MAG: SMI1/KNR4 family protein [Planctomycetota bacterium]REJ86979.1 MAG: SMI1/KNR4 family protein [Planctomycetota bacterium]REK24962.1 MAG: SMI1/KNR4 family protein [Planctomycetota bacterium]REK48549.1 MAG: SMI1/KNR4 family protein [Planctomycetota bacterium]
MPFPVDIKYVTETERKLGVKFPPSYVTRIVKSNGGEVEAPPDVWSLYPIYDTSDKKRLKRTCNDVVRETKAAKEWPDFPPAAVAIGANGCGDQLVLIPQADAPDILGSEVYWWDHETGELNKVADDLADL